MISDKKDTCLTLRSTGPGILDSFEEDFFSEDWMLDYTKLIPRKIVKN
jgi:hypothetical protein